MFVPNVYNKNMFFSFHFEILRLDFVDLGKLFLTYIIDISILAILQKINTYREYC